MARAIGATKWQRGFICRCHYLHRATVEVTRHMDTTIQTGDDMPAGQSNLTQFLCCAYVCTFCCGLRFYAQSHSDNGNFSMLCTCTRSGSPHNVLHFTSQLLNQPVCNANVLSYTTIQFLETVDSGLANFLARSDWSL